MSLVFASATFAADDVRKAEDWKKMYQDASAQLRAAQNRKAQMAVENAKLTAHVAELDKRLTEDEQQLASLHQSASLFAEQTFLLHSFYSGWTAFVHQNPWLFDQWNAFIRQDQPELPDDGLLVCDPRWPLARE